jgi:hypothetical protein
MTLVQDDFDKFADLLLDFAPVVEVPWVAIGIGAAFWLLVAAGVAAIVYWT